MREVALLFLKLGLIAFGGPAAHIALMRDEVVKRRRWLSDQQFLDLVGAANVIPGPTSTELAIYLGYTRAGPRGLVLAGALFILPAMLMVLAFAWAYVEFGSTPQAGAILYGIKPVIIAVVLQAIYGLGRAALKNWLLVAGCLSTILLYAAGANPLLPLFGSALAVMAVQNGTRVLARRQRAAAAAPFSLLLLVLTFLKIGATLYGSGYVLLAFVRDDFVARLGWLTDQQILDAVAVGQFTPGPVFTTATFIGYLVGSWPGAVLATLAVFLPSFLLVAVVYPLVPRLRASAWASAFLDGVNAAAVGLMAVVAWQLGLSSIVDPVTLGMCLVAAVLLLRWRVNSAWLVLAGAGAGLITTAVRA
jgi:chromate transporter